MVEQVLIEFIPDVTLLETAEQRLSALGKIDQRSAAIFKATNDQLKAREGITGKIVEATTKEQAVVAKLVASLKNLSGESKNAVQNLIKLSTTEITAGFEQAGVSVDDYIETLKKTGNTQPNFQVVNDQLKTQDALYGKLTLSVTKEQVAVNKLVSALKNLTGEARKSAEKLLSQSTEEIAAGFKAAGITVEQYIDRLANIGGASEGATKSTGTLKAQLRGMIEELARLKVAGLDQSEAYKKLAQEAGTLSDSIGDTAAEIRRLGSDTGALDGLIAGVQGLAGGFAVAQGAAALFGDESKEMQEVLLRVNSSMAILQGLQQLQNTLQKESAASLLIVNIQRKIQNAQIVVENALQSRSAIVRGLATVAQKALNVAMAANPIGIVITALVTVIGLFALYANGARKAAAAQAELNGALKAADEGLEGQVNGIKRSNAARISELEAAGGKQSEILRANAQAEVSIEQARQAELTRLRAAFEKNKNATGSEAEEALQKVNNRIFQLEQESSDARIDIEIKNREGRKKILQESLEDTVAIKQAEVDRIESIGGKNTRADFEARRAFVRAESALEIQNAGENSAKIISIRRKLTNELHQIDITEREQRQKETLASLETQLIKAQQTSRSINERTSQEEIDIQKKIITTTAQFESQQEGLSEKQRTEIRIKAIQQTTELQKEFNKKSIQETLEDYISSNNVQLSLVQTTEEQKLNLRIENIIAAAEIEITQNQGLSEKIKEINARRDAEIKAIRLQSIQETLAFELRVRETNYAEERRLIERTLSVQDELRSAPNQRERRRLEEMFGIRKLTIEQETNLIDEQTQHVLDGLKMQMEALKASKNLIPAKEYNQQFNELVDQQVVAVEEGEAKKRKAYKETVEEQKRHNQEMAQFTVDVTSQIGDLLLQGFQQSLDKQQQKIDQQKKRIEDLREAGAISEKEAADRLKQIAREEGKIKREQAQKDKEAAIFNAVINTAQAVIKAYATVGPIAGPVMAAIAGAIGAAQIALIASKPIPKFAKGKKDSYEGPGHVGEAGPEIIERNGQMYVAPKPTIIWIGKSDKIYNPKETKEILINRTLPTVNNKIMVNADKQVPIDYEKLGKVIGKHTSTNTTLSIDGYKEFIKEQQSFTTYLNHRRGY